MIETLLRTNVPYNTVSSCDYPIWTDDGATTKEWSAIKQCHL